MYKLILIDDEFFEIEQIKKLILQITSDYEIICFSNSLHALEYIKNNHIDLIITDIRMPQVSGIELIKQIDLCKPKTKIIILSGYAEFKYAREAMKYGIKHYLVKPISTEELINVLDEMKHVLDEEQYIKYTEKRRQYIEFFENMCIGWYSNKNEIKECFYKVNFPFDLNDSAGIAVKISVNNIKFDKNEEYERSIINILKDFLSAYIYGFYYKNSSFICYIIGNKNVDIDNISRIFNDKFQVSAKVEELDRFDNILNINGKKIYMVEDRMELFISKIIANDNIENKNVLKKIVEDCTSDGFNIDNLKNIVISGLFDEKHINVIKELNNEKKLNLDNKSAIDLAVEYIHNNYSGNVTLDEVSRVINMNPSYFSRYFKKCMGIGFHEYITAYKIDIAKGMLKENKTVEQITTELGFSDARSLRKNFNMIEGITLSDYRKRVRNNYGKKA